MTNKRKLRIGHNYDVTEYYKKVRGEDYTKYFICNDIYDFHVYRILEGCNSNYEDEPDTKLIEFANISKRDVLKAVQEDMGIRIYCSDIREFPRCLIDVDFEDYAFKSIIKSLIDLDGGDNNEDLKEYRYNTNISELIRDIDAGYGITVLDEDLNEC